MKQHHKKNSADYVLVYSTHPSKKKESAEIQDQPYNIKPAVRIEKKGRAGKAVTVLLKLPAHQTLLKAIEAKLKKVLGSGGTSYIKEGEGIVEIQGEHASTVLEALKKFKWP